MKARRTSLAAALAAVAAMAALAAVSANPAHAMPVFAQAYGENCEVCHSAVPALNAYGRYVQRTGYASLDPGTVHQTVPIWIGFNPTYDAQGSPKTEVGNLAIHGAGFIGDDFTFHAQEWFVNSNEPGFTDTLWVTYNNLLHRDGHLFFGKVQDSSPSPYSQWYELAVFAENTITVGEHSWEIGANRWGAKMTYEHNWIDAQAAYLGPSGDLDTAGDFNAQNDRSFDWLGAYAPPQYPFEIGAYGSQGVYPISDGTFDRYHAIGYYGEMDPMMGWMPGIFAVYQQGHDPDPGPGLKPATSTTASFDAFEPLFKQRVMLGARTDYSDDGLGDISHASNIDMEWLAVRQVSDRNASGIILNGEAAMAPGAGPDWVAQLWFVTTVGPLH
jgi:hypothetical protein